MNKSERLRLFSPLPCLFCRAAEVSPNFALCLAKWGSAAALQSALISKRRCFPVVFQLNVIFLGIALYKMFHHTAILKPDSGCLDNIK